MPRRKIRPSLDVDITWDDVQNKPNNLITGSGTSGRVAKFGGANAIEDSIITETSAGVQIDTGKTLVLNGYGLDWDGFLAGFPYNPSLIKDHFITSQMSSYWNGWTSTPYTVYYNHSYHYIRMDEYSGGPTRFLYRNISGVPDGTVFETNVHVGAGEVSGGIRLDNGYVDNSSEYSVEYYMKSTYDNAMWVVALYLRVKDGNNITEVRITPYFDIFDYATILLYCGIDAVYANAWRNAGKTSQYGLGGISKNGNINLTRAGLFIRKNTPSIMSFAQFHYYGTSL